MTAHKIPQVVIFLDVAGNPHAEIPGLNGARQKIDLPPGWLDKNPEIHTVLLTERMKLGKAPAEPRQNPVRVDPELERAKRIEEGRLRKIAEWNAHIASLPEPERIAALAKRDKALELAKQRDLDRARSVYSSIATNHSISLANQAIRDPRRRPRKKLAVGVWMVSPQNSREMGLALAGKNPRSPRSRWENADPNLAVNIKLRD